MAQPTPSIRGAQVVHAENLQAGGVLVVCNRLRPHDLPRLVRLFGDRRPSLLEAVAPGAGEEMRQAVQATGLPVIPFTADGIDALLRTISSGQPVVFVPPQVAALPLLSPELPGTVLADLASLGVPVQPVGVDHPREFSLRVDPTAGAAPVIYSIGPVVPAEELTPGSLQEALIGAGADAFAARPGLNVSLGWLIIAGMKRHGSITIRDGQDGSETPYSKIFAAAAALAGVIRKETRQPRIGIALPPGRAGLIANLAAVFAGKIPVNLNFTAGKEAVESAIRQSALDRIMTADAFVRKMQTFPWPPTRQLIFLERTLPAIKGRIIRWLLLAKLLPAGALARLLGVSREGGDREAALLFTSGSSGDPKGVVLSHRNLVANVTQFSLRLGMGHADNVLGSLPLFHSFGCTVTLWWPVIEGIGLVTYPNPLDSPKLAELIEKHGVTLMLSTPTFLRGFLKRVKREQLASVRLIVTGAEKLPMNLEEEFRKKFGKPVMEGYGLTETSPATNVNLPEPEGNGLPVLPSRRRGSVGPLLPGIAVRITDPVAGGPLPPDQPGIIWFRGPNVFNGYLNQPKRTAEVVQEGWFRTGDIGRLDGDGFLYIEGRLSRFSKIGGEMVPHEVVEEHINKALNLDTESERKVAVVGVPDAEKGEALVLLSTISSEAVKQEIIQLRYTLLERGVPALWIPRRLVRVEQIPVLASGKLDIRTCERLAAHAVE